MRRLLVALLFVPGLAFAQPAQPARPSIDHQKMATDDCARARKAKKTCVLDMGAEKIDGRTILPDGMIIDTWEPAKKTSLIRLRRDFIPEIIKSANEID